MYTLYWSRRTAAFAADAALSEAGVDFRRVEVKRTNGRVDDPEFEKISPMKQIPALVLPSGLVMTESSAMVLAIADSYPEKNLLPAPGTDLRAMAYRWLVHLVVNIYESDLRYSYPDRYTADPNGVPAVKMAGAQRMDRGYQVLEEGLGNGPWFLGDTYSVLDIYLGMNVCWHYDTPALLARSPKVAAICAKVAERPKMKPLFEMYGMPELFDLV